MVILRVAEITETQKTNANSDDGISSTHVMRGKTRPREGRIHSLGVAKKMEKRKSKLVCAKTGPRGE